MSFSENRFFQLIFSSLVFTSVATATTYNGTPLTYVALLKNMVAGDTLNLAAGTYPTLVVSGISGTSSAWITITGPTSGSPAVIQGALCCNTVEILNSSFVAIKNLRIDSRGIAGVFGVSAKGGTTNLVHDILLEGNVFVGQNGSQQTDGISTKTPTWGWIIRKNTIIGAGTGLYLGNSDGTDPFVAGLIENNLIQNTIGYNAQVKYQITRPTVPGMPTGQSITIIRNNVFIKNDQASPDGNRPNLLVGGFPSTGAGSTDWYEVYGNFFDHNPRESLFQASGRVTIHDNVFVDGQYTALALQNQDLPLKIAYVYNNTIYTSQAGIRFGTAASVDDAVTGNLVFAATPITGTIAHSSNNMQDTVANAVLYVAAPSFTLGSMDFFPKLGKAQGSAIDLSTFTFDTDYSLDFNGTSKTAAKGSIVFRGAYAGDGTNPGWDLQAGIKPPPGSGGQVALKSLQCTPTILTSGTQTNCVVSLTAATGSALTVALSSNNPAATVPATVTIPSGLASASFKASAGPVTSSQSVTLTATLNGTSVTTTLTINPLPVLPALASMTCAPGTITSGGTTTCTVSLTAAPTTATVVALSSNNPILSPPISVTVAAGSTSAQFTATAGTVSSSQSVVLTASLNSTTKTATVIVGAATSVFSLNGNTVEIPGTVNGTIVTPTTGPSGYKGLLKIRGTGTFAFTPVLNGNGMLFGPGGGQNANTAFISFSGSQVGNLFNMNAGDIIFYLRSSFSLAERLALPAPVYDWVFDVFDNSQRLFTFLVNAGSGRLRFTYCTGSVAEMTYYVPVGTEDAVFGKGITAKFRLTWDGVSNSLYINDILTRPAITYTKAVPNWSSLSVLTLGTSAPYNGGYSTLRDALAGFTIQ